MKLVLFKFCNVVFAFIIITAANAQLIGLAMESHGSVAKTMFFIEKVTFELL